MHIRKRRRGYFTLRRKRSARSRLLQDDSRPVCRQDVILQGCFRQLAPDTAAYNFRTGEIEKMGKIVFVKGAKQEDAPAIIAGDIGVVTKMAGVKTGDTLCDPKNILKLAGVDFPKPCLSMAVKVSKRVKRKKRLPQVLQDLWEEDPTITFALNKETREQVLSGLGEQHLDVIVSKLKNKFGVDVTLGLPKVAYRETIRKPVEAQGKHKKQVRLVMANSAMFG